MTSKPNRKLTAEESKRISDAFSLEDSLGVKVHPTEQAVAKAAGVSFYKARKVIGMIKSQADTTTSTTEGDAIAIQED